MKTASTILLQIRQSPLYAEVHLSRRVLANQWSSLPKKVSNRVPRFRIFCNSGSIILVYCFCPYNQLCLLLLHFMSRMSVPYIGQLGGHIAPIYMCPVYFTTQHCTSLHFTALHFTALHCNAQVCINANILEIIYL